MIQKITRASTRKELKTHGVKFSKWAEAYLNPKSATYGNASKSAMKVYNCKSYSVARVIGSQNTTKLSTFGLTLSEIEGRGAVYWYKLLAAKAINGTYEQTINYMQIIGILEKDNNVSKTK